MDIQKMTAAQCVAAIIAEMDAVKKAKGDNVNYKFRNVDQVMDAINPYLGKFGLSPHTEIVSFTSGAFEAVKKGYNNAPDTLVRKTTGSIHVRINLVKDIWLENGTLLTTKVSFEGTASSDDSGDKALTQAQSNAVKYALIFGFCMKSSDTDPDDTNHGDTEIGKPQKKSPVAPIAPVAPTAEKPKVEWTQENFPLFMENRQINMKVVKNTKMADIWVLKYATDSTGKKGFFTNATNEQLKQYFQKHADYLKDKGVVLPTELA